MAGISFGYPSAAPVAPRRATGGVSVYNEDAARKTALEEGERNRLATEAATRARQAELNAAEDRNRAIQQERDMASANAQNAVNVGGTSSGEYGYAYPGGGGSSPAPASLDLSQLTALKQQVTPAAVPPPSYVEDRGASDAAFGRAKDKAGLLALRRMSDSRRQFAQRGLTGGGGEARAMDAVLGDASSGLQDFALGQAQTEAGLARQATDRNYQGALTQRSQDISMIPTLLSLLRASQGAVY